MNKNIEHFFKIHMGTSHPYGSATAGPVHDVLVWGDSLFLELIPDCYFVVVLVAVPPGLFVAAIPAGVASRLLSPKDQDLLAVLVWGDSLFLELIPDCYFGVVLVAVPPGLFVDAIPAGVVPWLLSPQDQDSHDALVLDDSLFLDEFPACLGNHAEPFCDYNIN